jgi:hypothetical protein
VPHEATGPIGPGREASARADRTPVIAAPSGQDLSREDMANGGSAAQGSQRTWCVARYNVRNMPPSMATALPVT